MLRALVILGFLLLFLLSACGLMEPKAITSTNMEENEYEAITSCINICQQYKLRNPDDMDMGPCLSNTIAPGWVCDVAHNPREDVDNLPENQCKSFRLGDAQHFVEVDEECEIIRTY